MFPGGGRQVLREGLEFHAKGIFLREINPQEESSLWKNFPRECLPWDASSSRKAFLGDFFP